MAGTVLFLAKTEYAEEEFLSKTRLLKEFVNEIFKTHFQTIIFRELDKKTFLIEFRQSDQTKFYMDREGNWLTFEGTVFALDETISYDAKELLKLYNHFGEDFAKRLDGHFVIKIYDKKTDSYFIINDVIKGKTNFHAENELFITFTSFLLTTGIVKEAELDLYAFNEFMWRYYILSERSLLKGVKKLSPASIYIIRNGTISCRTYWEWPHQYTDLSFDNAVDKMAESMKETARLIDTTFTIPCIDFTMGQDSRQIICGFTNQGLDIVTATFGKEDFYEVQGVEAMAVRHRIKHRNVQLTEEFYENIWHQFRRALILGSCEEPGYLLSRILFMREQYKKFGDVALNGTDGHFYKNGLWDEMYTFNFYREPEKFDIDVFLRYRALSKDYYDAIFVPDFLKVKRVSKKYFSQLIENSIRSYLESPVSIQVDRFDLYHWLNFAIAANNGANALIPTISPLLLRRNLEFALTIPVKWKFNLSKFQRAVVYNLDPALAREKTDFGGVNMIPKNVITYIPFYLKYFFFQSSRLRNKIKSILGLKVVTHLQEAWDYLPVYQKLFADENLKANLNYKEMKLSKIIEMNEWNKFIDNFDPNTAKLDEFEYLFKIASIEAFLKLANQIG